MPFLLFGFIEKIDILFKSTRNLMQKYKKQSKCMLFE